MDTSENFQVDITIRRAGKFAGDRYASPAFTISVPVCMYPTRGERFESLVNTAWKYGTQNADIALIFGIQETT